MSVHKCSLRDLAGAVRGDQQRENILKSCLAKNSLPEFNSTRTSPLTEPPLDESLLQTRPWRNLPKYFTQVLISAVALVKMSAHAKSGGSIEIMGMLTGRIIRNLFIVTDVYSLPVEGTETRVNAQSEAYEFMVQYLDNLKETKPKESIVGWYHSHPGYGCWLSGIDVATQSLNQNFQDPYLAIVVDPARTLNQGKVEIGAFRTFPVGYVDENESKKKTPRNLTSIETNKANTQDMGAHSDQYYSLDIKLFKGPQDDELINSILDKSWVSNIVQTEAFTNSYEEKVLDKMLQVMKRELFGNWKAETHHTGRYERLFERLVSMHSATRTTMAGPAEEQTSKTQHPKSDLTIDRLSRYMNEESLDGASLGVVEESTSSESQEMDENEEEGADAPEDADNDNESRIGLDGMEDDDDVDAQSIRTREGEDGTSDRRMSPDPEHTDSYFEEYETGYGGIDELQKKGLKRNLPTSSIDSKGSVSLGSSTRENRKRFAAGDAGCAVDNELKHKMHALQLELQYHAKQTKSIGQAELVSFIGKRARQRVFGNQNVKVE